MLINTHHIYGTAVVATDKSAGTVRDLLFDDRTWDLKFFVVHSGPWLTGQSELLAPDVVDRPDWMARQLCVRLTVDEVLHSPPPEAHPPASMGRDLQQAKLVAWDAYWAGLIDESLSPPGDPHLDSAKDLSGYHIVAADGEIGHVVDFLIDDETWIVRYIVMDTRNWLPGKHVLVIPSLVESMDWESRKVRVRVSREAIRQAPSFEVAVPVSRAYEEQLYEHYSEPKYW
jgi:hypothetical protein